jgi:hypothetical protein
VVASVDENPDQYKWLDYNSGGRQHHIPKMFAPYAVTAK